MSAQSSAPRLPVGAGGSHQAARASRKDEHLDLALRLHGQDRPNAFDDVAFMHHALAATAATQVDPSATVCGAQWAEPFYINAMTGGTRNTMRINSELAGAAAEAGVAVACGSQHIALDDPERAESFRIIRRRAPRAFILANVGPTMDPAQAVRAVEMLEANALQIHLNAAQELVMPEGDRDLRDWAQRIDAIVKAVPVPVVVKEVGFGISARTMASLSRLGASAVDVAGTGGTDFIAIENERRPDHSYSYLTGWGQSTVLCLLESLCAEPAARRPGGDSARGTERPVGQTDEHGAQLEVLASGGVRHPLDVVRALALGARAVGVSGHFLRTLSRSGPEGLRHELALWSEQVRTLMTLLGAADIAALRRTDLLVTGRTAEQARLLGVDLPALARRSTCSG
ncbi:alpha-hydroxy-acid oxidizing protein [Actinomyces slackii]|uniref:Isopentenyl-diphosphate delta-isomerase n=1 Tax=Actinomyces slackii TaxID=52774 RepID=A0A3S4WI94_9ACTO|nr:alpha-hydroxy-acid oxidizing protein [Actinomyces slackii]VEG75587.1 Isopentenyl-diphosphate delta-isomerase [Actinomyces slackii]